MGAASPDKQINTVFRVLSAFAILLVVAGHADFHILDMGGLFPYYSFHVTVFLFISGYFYEETAERETGAYLCRKAYRLLAPYFIWNLFYGLFATVLHGLGFTEGRNIGFWELFVEPFLGGHQFGWNFPSWFVPALFVVEVLNVFMRKALGWLRWNKEWLILSACLLAGMFTVWLAIGGHVWGYYKFPGRILFMMPCYQMGYFYKKKLEKRDTLPDGIYFGVLLVLQLVIVYSCRGLAYSVVWCTSFANGPAVPYLTAVTGIAFWLRVSKILAPFLGKCAGVDWLGRNTYAVMMHHMLGFLLVKGILYGVYMFSPWCRDFDAAAFFGDAGYVYVPAGMNAFRWVYVAAGIAVPFLLKKGAQETRRMVRRRVYGGE